MARAADKDKSKKDKSKSQDNLDPKTKALQTALSHIETTFGKGAIMKLGGERQEAVPVISTGSISLDAALGVGGIPRGRIIEIYGPESSGKTTLALHVVAEAQKIKNAQGQNGVAAFIDAEHALDVTYARRLGVNTDELLISQPDNGEQALNIAEILVRSGAVDLIVVDSVAALVPEAEINGDMGSSHPGLIARLMSQAMRKLTGAIYKSNCSVIFINQVRLKIGPSAYGNPETTTGGYALKFYATMRLDIRRTHQIKGPEDAKVGYMTRVKVVKNKIAPPFKEATFDIIFGQGISRESELLDLGVVMEIVEKNGGWYSYNGERLGNGKDVCRRFLVDNPELAKEIEERLRGAYGLLADKVTEVMSEHPLEPLETEGEGDTDPALTDPTLLALDNPELDA
ncbi:MAG: recombinase RecA [Deltaproteobacteria bacterium]|jgi:recombination protein RecA|nr:recombinase RecA [Deltaproteobacteria bacterium]